MLRAATVGVSTAQVAGAWCGIAAPLLLGTYLAVAARLRRGYDRTRDTMSALGDGVDIAAFGFLLANAAVGGLLFLFAWWTMRPEFGGVATAVVMGGALASLVIGLTAGDESCALPGVYGRPLRGVHVIHLVTVSVALVGIGVLPILVWQRGDGPDGRPFRIVNGVLAIVFVVVAVAVAAMIVVGRRQLAARLIRGRRRRPGVVPWSEPAVWLDRWGLAEYLLWTVGYSWVVAVAVATLRPGWVVPSTIAFGALASAATWWPQRIVPVVRFSVESCQQNTVHGLSGRAVVGEFRFYEIDDPCAVERSIRELLADDLLVGERRRSRTGAATRAFTLTVGVTRAGLHELGVPYRWGGPRPDAFGRGMSSRRASLGDAHDDWERHWEHVDIAVWAYAEGRDALGEALVAMDRLRGVRQLDAVEVRRTTRDDRTPFDGRDGISQPWVLGVPAPSHQRVDPRGGGKIGTWGKWQPLALGEFVLGQVDESNDVFPVPDPAPLFIGGTFAVVRKLEIDDERLNQLLTTLAPSETESDTLARLVGRTVDGHPLIPAPDDNRFRYRDDPEGQQCPVTAHIRRANPRDTLGFDGALANRRRMIRRGLAYVDGPEAALQGLMFVSLQARLDDQFEFVQRAWLNDGGSFGLGRDPDALSGHWTDGARQVVLPTHCGPPAVATTEPITRARGGAYLLVPSIRGLHYLADGSRPHVDN